MGKNLVRGAPVLAGAFFLGLFAGSAAGWASLATPDSAVVESLASGRAALPEEVEEEAERARKAADILAAMVTQEDRNIPDEILAHAEAVAVIPNVIKGAFMVGGRHGKGLVSQRTGTGWSSPLYVEIGGASFGFQVGVQSTDLVLVFTEKKGLKAMLEDKVKLGADIAVAAGPVGREGAVGANATFDTPIYSYSRSEGVFAGVSLEGAVLDLDDGSNRDVYGKGFDAADLLAGVKHVETPVTAPFVEALRKHVPARD
jgi:lipid-binding SYLF domain-containing protein